MSDYTTTPNYALRKPVVGADNDKWGGDWNLNADTIDTQIKARADAIAALGTMAQQNANSVNVTGGSTKGQTILGLASGDTISFGTVPGIAVVWTDKYGFAGATWNADRTWTFPAGLSNTPSTLTNPSAPSFLYSLSGATVNTLVGTVPGIALALCDQYYLSNFTVSAAGVVVGGVAASPTSYSAADITARNNAALARSQQVKGRVNTTAARPVWKYNHIIWYGQSEIQGFAGTPSLTKSQPFDNLMLGQGTRPQPMGGTTWVPKGDAGFHPLIAIDTLNNGVSTTIKTGTIQNCQGCTFTAGGLITITTGAALNSVFAVGDVFQMQGWTGGGGFNNDTNYTVTAVTATTIQVAETYQTPITTPQNGIGFWQFGGNYFGEDFTVEALNFWRRQQLDFRGLAADPSRLLVGSAAGKSGTQISLLAKGASPEVFNQLRDLTNAGKTAATAAGGDHGIPVICYLQGGTDALNGTDYASYHTAFIQMYTDMCNDLLPITGQSKKPFYFFGQVSDGTSTDTNDMAIARAQYDVMLSPPSPDWYCFGPTYFTTDWAPHQDNNGYRHGGGLIGKILHRVIERGEGWMPLHPTAITVRGRQILVDFHVPEPPLQSQPVWNKHTAVSYADLGFSVLDDAGSVPLSSVAIVADACVLITIGRALSTNPKLRYGDGSHAGGGNLCDSDPAVAEVNYLYTDGSGQGPSANIPALIGAPQPLFNWCCLFSVPIVAG